MPTYSQQDLNRIATALGLSSDEVLKYRNGFEAAATTYRLNIPPAKRAGGPTFELRNRCPKNVKKPSELRKKHSKKPKTLSELRKKAKQVEAAAKKLLLHLGVRRPSEAPDGPGDGELLIFLASYSGSSEEELTAATALVGRLPELVEAIRATKSFELYAHRAAQEAAEFARLIPKGHQGDIAVIGWLAHMMSIYKRITGKEPRFSVHRPGHGRGKPSGRFLLFVQAAAVPLEINLSPSSARSRQRALRAAVRHRQE